MDAAGSVRNLTAVAEKLRPPTTWFPSWSLDSRQINVISDRSGARADADRPDGGNPRTLTAWAHSHPVRGRPPRLGSLGRRTAPGESRQIVWSSLRDLNLELYVMDGDGETGCGSPAILPATGIPSGRQMAAASPFSSDRDGNENVYVIDVNGANRTV
jgi:Tol biopolymer transport system component